MIICCGEALIDFVPSPDGLSYRPCPGGSILNIAVGLGKMEVPVGFFCQLSTDFFGDLLVQTLLDSGVDISLCPRKDGQTTLAFVSLPKPGEEEPQFAFYSNGAVDRSMKVENLPEKLDDKVKALHFGSISLLLEPGATALEHLMKRESRQRMLSLDPNVRPAVIPDKEIFKKRFENWLNYVDILRLSHADLSFIYPNDKIDELVPKWFEKGLSLIILTQGEEGAIGFGYHGIRTSVPAQRVIVKDTVGAGDSFFSAILTYLYDHQLLYNRQALRDIQIDELTDCLLFASKAAAINCTREGANPPFRYEMG